MSLFLVVHIAISVLGLVGGAVVAIGMLRNAYSPFWTALFLATTVLTSAGGFLLPSAKFMPSHAFAILSLVLLAAALYALYARKLSGGWRTVYVVTALIALYLNFFVLIAQAFLKVPALKALAPTQSEPPFALAQGALLVLFVALGYFAKKRFHAAV
jgi:hypothetical protein